MQTRVRAIARSIRFTLVALALVTGCSDGSVSSEADAQTAYLGLDAHVDKAIALGFAGFNSASSANIAPQMTTGTATGTLTVTGQVDQGSSANKGMRLIEALVAYSDDGKLTYATDAAAGPALTMQLKGVPTGTLTGSLAGAYAMTGSLDGSVTLSLAFTGQLQAGAASAVERKPGTTHITGSAVSKYGSYTIDLTR